MISSLPGVFVREKCWIASPDWRLLLLTARFATGRSRTGAEWLIENEHLKANSAHESAE